jgi:chaperonin cofactor prefoldin
VGSEYADDVVDLDDGEAFVQMDWSDEQVTRVQFKRKRTFDAGATPGLDDFERPDLKSVSGSLMEDLDEITSRKEQEQDRIAELEAKVENREERIAELESELETARDVSAAARKMANALAHGDGSPPDSYQATLQTKNEQIERLESRIAELESKVEDAAAASTPVESGDDDQSAESSGAGTESDTEPSAGGSEGDGESAESTDPDEATFSFGDEAREDRDALVDAVQDRLRRRGERLQLEEGADDADQPAPEAIVDLLQAPPVVTRVNAARRESKCNEEAAWTVVSELATNPGATAHDLAGAGPGDVEAVHTLLSELRGRDLVLREDREYAFNPVRLRELVEQDDPSKPRTELRDQWQP